MIFQITYKTHMKISKITMGKNKKVKQGKAVEVYRCVITQGTGEQYFITMLSQKGDILFEDLISDKKEILTWVKQFTGILK